MSESELFEQGLLVRREVRVGLGLRLEQTGPRSQDPQHAEPGHAYRARSLSRTAHEVLLAEGVLS